jgi:UDP-N-acetylmuramoyl-tripeptide--D-alanyl-D-alanine ligase
VDVTLALHGAHHALNAAATAAAGLAAGLPLDAIATGLRGAAAHSAHRMDLRRRRDGLVVVDDAYNANPESMRAALDALTVLGSGRRTWAVLGEMRELGADSAELHRAVGAHAAAVGVDELVAVGAASPVADGAAAVDAWAGRARSVPDPPGALGLLLAETSGRDAVLVKASNSVELWQVADGLLAADGPAA